MTYLNIKTKSKYQYISNFTSNYQTELQDFSCLVEHFFSANPISSIEKEALCLLHDLPIIDIQNKQLRFQAERAGIIVKFFLIIYLSIHLFICIFSFLLLFFFLTVLPQSRTLIGMCVLLPLQEFSINQAITGEFEIKFYYLVPISFCQTHIIAPRPTFYGNFRVCLVANQIQTILIFELHRALYMTQQEISLTPDLTELRQ